MAARRTSWCQALTGIFSVSWSSKCFRSCSRNSQWTDQETFHWRDVRRREDGCLSGSTVLFLCVANSARSQMAEGLARAAAPSVYRFLSAGSAPGTLHPLAVAALAYVCIDISRQRANRLSDIPLADEYTIMTPFLDDDCPVVPGAGRRIHWPLPDPARVA